MSLSLLHRFALASAAVSAILLCPILSFAQSITLDGTLGTTAPLPTFVSPPYATVYDIPQGVGQTVGTNLFHSFARFNLTATEAASFGSDAGIRNIISRVTGGTASLIDGLIFTQSRNVNLFLINPAGIVFGSNAQLNVGSSTQGSFVATTLDAITFPGGGQFSAVNPGDASSLLTLVGDPSGFLSSQRTLQPITVNSSTLGVYPGQSLILLGGNVDINNALLTWYIPPAGTFVNGIHIGIGGVDGAGTAGLNVDGNQLSLQISDGQTRADVSVTNRSELYVKADNGGSISVYGKNLNILGGSQLLAGIEAGSGSPSSRAGDITLNASETLTIAGHSTAVYNDVDANAVGNGGNVNIFAGSFIMKDGIISADTFGKGSSGRVNIAIQNLMSLDGKNAASFIFSNVGNRAEGNGSISKL